MPVIYIRDVSEEELRAFKVEAARAGKSLPKWALERLRPGGGNGLAGRTGADEAQVARPEGEEAESVVAVPTGGKRAAVGKGDTSAKEKPAKSRKGVEGHPSICMCRLCEAARR